MTFLDIISKAKSKILKTQGVSKTRNNIVLEKPAYFNRHKGRDFLILGTGSSLNEYGERIKTFAKKNNLIVIGCNNITPFIIPDYHAFINRHRFNTYGPTIDLNISKVLLSIYFTDDRIQKIYPGSYDFIMWENMESPEDTYIETNGIIRHYGSSATLTTMIAYVMGANKIYLAGVDGYNPNVNNIHYTYQPYKKGLSMDQLDAKYKHWFLSIQGNTFDAISLWAAKRHRLPFASLTPTMYNKYYDPKLLSNVFIDEK